MDSSDGLRWCFILTEPFFLVGASVDWPADGFLLSALCDGMGDASAVQISKAATVLNNLLDAGWNNPLCVRGVRGEVIKGLLVLLLAVWLVWACCCNTGCYQTGRARADAAVGVVNAATWICGAYRSTQGRAERSQFATISHCNF